MYLLNYVYETCLGSVNRSKLVSLPNKMKIAKVIPNYKNSDPVLIKKNYRPVSLLTAISKLIEK
jgi:hypothetical protein